MIQDAALEPAPEAVTGGRDAAEVLPELAARPPATDGAGALPQRLADLEAKVAAAISRGRSAATLRAYGSDWADFTTWCATVGLEALPAAPATVAGYVAEMASPPDDRSQVGGGVDLRPTPPPSGGGPAGPGGGPTRR